jgi:hypothetical protein
MKTEYLIGILLSTQLLVACGGGASGASTSKSPVLSSPAASSRPVTVSSAQVSSISPSSLNPSSSSLSSARTRSSTFSSRLALSSSAASLAISSSSSLSKSSSHPGSSASSALATVYSAWLINSDNEISEVIRESGAGILVNVQSVNPVAQNGQIFAKVVASGIPNYKVILTQDLIDWIQARPRANLMNAKQRDLVTGAVTARVGDEIDFGEDIGYRSDANESSCPENQGYGYWPPGPTCPQKQAKQGYFTEAPAATAATCETSLGSVGYAINGTSIYNWADGQSYNNAGVWHTLAPYAEIYDVDICGGHAARGDYHHHFYSACWAEAAGEDGQGHSPIYGYAADGYPVYGPWYDTNVPAKSCWKTRDYTVSSATGCGANGVRNCLLVDQYDFTKGTKVATASGPTTAGSFTSLSRNTFTTSAGFFFEDYYFDAACASGGGAALDEHNGHSHGDYGYHYHVTIASATDKSPAFPYTFGPRYKGVLPSNAIARCGTQ